MTLRTKFKLAQRRVWKLPDKPSDEELLVLYALFKQATVGNSPAAPTKTGLRERWKWKVWKRLQGISSNEAMTRYCDKVDALMSANA